MAIKTFKEVLENKGYRIDSNDRQIFESGTIESFFGISPNDAIEFIVYDSSDNQLPQRVYGDVRYIPLTSENIGDYFMIAEGTIFQKYKFPSEYFIDVEKLLKEAGYENGTFKTQVTLINKRIGSQSNLDKLWISEISPSRTEIRLYPNEKGVQINSELKERFNLLINDSNFRDDVAKYSISFVEKINPASIGTFIKGKYSEAWFDKFRSEYKIENFDIFCTNVHKTFLESCINEFTGKISNINDINYGKPKPYKETISLSKEDVKKIIEVLIVNAINKYLLIPDVRYGSKKVDRLESLDSAPDILQSKNADLQIDTKSPTVSKVVKKSVEQSEKTLTLDKLIVEEVKNEPIPPVITRPSRSGGYSGGGYDYAGSYRNSSIPGARRGMDETQNLR
jgi:hypothetical protein